MPCLEVTLPSQTKKVKEQLTAELTAAFVEATGFEKKIFSIYFHETDAGNLANGGVLGAATPAHIVLFCPRIRRPAKQKLVELFTKALASSIGGSPKPIVHICEHPYDNIGVEGKLLSDAYEECAKRSFYYELPRE